MNIKFINNFIIILFFLKLNLLIMINLLFHKLIHQIFFKIFQYHFILNLIFYHYKNLKKICLYLYLNLLYGKVFFIFNFNHLKLIKY